MTREYLFRAKRTDNGEWVEGYYSVYGFGNAEFEPCIVTRLTKYGGLEYIQVDPATVGQYIGVDEFINGKRCDKIFEGDSVRMDLGDKVIDGVIEYCSGAFWVVRGNEFWPIDKYDCLRRCGNIHDNPELLTPPPRTI